MIVTGPWFFVTVYVIIPLFSLIRSVVRLVVGPMRACESVKGVVRLAEKSKCMQCLCLLEDCRI